MTKPRWLDPGNDDIGLCSKDPENILDKMFRWLRHDWDDGDDTNNGCCTSTTRYTCRTCGAVKHRNNGMG